MLHSFTPYVGGVGIAGVEYGLPPYAFDTFAPTLDSDKMGTDSYEMADADGSYLATGRNPSYIADMVISLVFDLHEGWRLRAGYTPDPGGLITAKADFYQRVLNGGLGILKIQYPGGVYVTDPTNGNQVRAFRAKCTAKITGGQSAGALTEDWSNLNRVKIKAALQIPSGRVTVSPGNIPIPMLL